MLGLRFLKSGTQVTLEQTQSGEEKEAVLNLDLKLQLSVANLLEVLLKNCQTSELVAPSGDVQGVADDRDLVPSPLAGSGTEKENTVSSPMAPQAAVAKASRNEGEDPPCAAAKLGLVHPQHDGKADDGSVEIGVVGWESFTGNEPPAIATEDASFLNTPQQKLPSLTTCGPAVAERSSVKKKNKIEEFPVMDPSDSAGLSLAVIETHLRELSQSLSFAHETHQASLQQQERNVHGSMISLGDRIYNLASNMKFQTASISRGVAEQNRRLDSVCEGISSLEKGVLSELSEIREISISQLKQTQTPQTAQMSTAASSKDNAGASPVPYSHKPS